MPLALWQRGGLFLVWPLSMGAGAWLGLRDRRSRMRELLATTARPGWQRAIPTAGALSIALALGYVVTFAAAGVQVGLAGHVLPARIPAGRGCRRALARRRGRVRPGDRADGAVGVHAARAGRPGPAGAVRAVDLLLRIRAPTGRSPRRSCSRR